MTARRRGVDGATANGAEPLLQVEELRVAFPTPAGPARAVDGVSFQVEAGEVVGLVGESGCGKTVTCRALLGLVPPPGEVGAGSSIRFQGRELAGAGEPEWEGVRGTGVGMVFQDAGAALNPVLSVGDQIGEVLRHRRGMERREAAAEAIRLLDEVGIPDPGARARAFPHQLSGGMRQRVQVAVALAGEPALLVADEPTTALDVSVQARILELLAREQEERGMALLLATHDLGVVATLCQRVLVMYAGQIVEEGSVEEILEAPAHPYTRALLASVPVLGDPGRTLRPLEGEVPSPVAWPGGCRLHPRCPEAFHRCGEAPPLFGEGHRSRCWLAAPAGEDGPPAQTRPGEVP